jgi:hypothetical protein
MATAAADPTAQVDLKTVPISPTGENGASDAAGNENVDPNGVKKTYGENDEVTVFHDPDNFNVKHPLMHEWTLWFTKPPSGKVRFSIHLCLDQGLVANIVSDRATTGTIFSKRW